MKSLLPLLLFLAGFLVPGFAQTPPVPAPPARALPDALVPWIDWATWADTHRHCPNPYGDPATHLCFWPSRASLQASADGAQFELAVELFHESWVPLPGSAELWPRDARIDGAPAPVIAREDRPAVRLPAGVHRLQASYQWRSTPQRLPVPASIGILSLVVEGRPVESPAWDADGTLWLKRDAASDQADKDFLAVKVSSAIEDGIPLWLRTEVELTVGGKSREEDLGTVVPEGWKIASVESPVPVAVDEAGRMKAQVRAGKWEVKIDAFRADRPQEVRYAAGSKPAAGEQLIALRARPEFRVVELMGAPAVDISQTTFPERWRELPVFRWTTTEPLRLEERLRGMGDRKVAGLGFAREWWLDEDGGAFTFRDVISGQMQQVWRLDVTEGQDLGSVRSGGVGQLITRNPQTSAAGVEIRDRSVQLEATGRMPRTEQMPATGWRSDAESVNVDLHLPPGWRLFALFGADWVRGDWLTAWTLLDLFLLLIFTLAVFRLWGFFPAVLAFLAFGISYHEPGAPRFAWLALLVPLALLRVVPDGGAKRVISVLKWGALLVFVIIVVPFLAAQVQQALYPQLERVGAGRDFPGAGALQRVATTASASEYSVTNSAAPSQRQQAAKSDNLQFEAKARIQTGPGVPEWKWRTVGFGWNGPVSATQRVRPILIPVTVERAISVARVLLLLGLAAALLRTRRSVTVPPAAAKAALLLAGLLLPTTTHAQSVPSDKTLQLLRERVLEKSDAFPHAADLPSVSLTLRDRRLTMDVEVHAAVRTAVPLPGKLPTWSPLSIFLDDAPEVALRRDDGFLWVVVPPGVHRVRVEGALAAATEWQWTFQLRPRRVSIDAPGWTVSGVGRDGVPEAQVFFALQQPAAAGQASYDRQDLQTIATVERSLELGLAWQVRTTVRRLSPPGKAIAIRVPLLAGENVFSAGAQVRDGFMEVRLGAQEESFSWESGMAPTERLALTTRAEDSWVERWQLVVSPVWNVGFDGLAPVFEPAKAELVPVWQPWPGESVQLSIGRPDALPGATVTVHRGEHSLQLGRRQRTSRLELSIQCSLGEDFLIELPEAAEVTTLEHAGKSIPVRREGTRLMVPLRPGEQTVTVGWKTSVPLEFAAITESVRLPVESANISTTITVPDDRWVLWTAGPRIGPAIRFWVILLTSLLAAIALGRIPSSPLRTIEWMLLTIGLTQVPLPAALVVIAWLFLLAWRGRDSARRLSAIPFNLVQLGLIGLTVLALGVLVFAVGEGLLGSPEMFIGGNHSSRTVLKWFQARSGTTLPQPHCYSISTWWFRGFMLLWALWLAASLLRWLRKGWQNFSSGGLLRRRTKTVPAPAPSTTPPPAPPPLPTQA